MIKISAIFPKRDSKREISVQTQALLPNIFCSWRKYRPPLNPSKHPSAKYDQDQLKQCRQSSDNTHSIRSGCKSVVFSSKFTKKKVEGCKENMQMLRETSKIQAKSFRFLKMEDVLLKQTIVAYLENRSLSKNQSKKINEKIKITFVFRCKQTQDCGNIKESCLFNSFQLPEESEEYFSLKEVIDKIKQAYGRLNTMSKEKGNGNHLSNNKRIAQLSQMFIQNNGKVINQEIRNQGKSNKVYLLSYLQKFIKDNDLKDLYFDDSSNKQKLMNFYEQIYNRYESIPFTDQLTENDSQLTLNNKIPQTPSDNPCTIQTAFIPTLKKQKSAEDSFIKLRFYNNLRKQIHSLAEDTDKILSQEGNKMPHD